MIIVMYILSWRIFSYVVVEARSMQVCEIMGEHQSLNALDSQTVSRKG